MQQRFDTSLQPQREWSWLLAIYIFLGGSGAGAYLLCQTLGLPAVFGLGGLASVVVGGVVLLLELGSPLRAWRAATRVRTSWVSRGFLSVMGLLVFGGASLTLEKGSEPAAQVVYWLSLAFGLSTTLYPAMILSASRSIPFWRTPLMPILFAGVSLLGACGAALLALPWFEQAVAPRLVNLTAGLVAVVLVLLLAHLRAMSDAGEAAAQSVRILTRGDQAGKFWVGVIGLGLVLPGGLLAFGAVLPLAGAGIVAGCLQLRYCVLKAGVYVPPPPAAEGMTFRRLARGRDRLAAEYVFMAQSRKGAN